MTEALAAWDLPAEPPRSRASLHPVDGDHVRCAGFRERVRIAGEQWTGGRPNELMSTLVAAAGNDPRLVALVRAGCFLLQDFLDGHSRRMDDNRSASSDLPEALLEERPVAQQVLDELAEKYLIGVASHRDKAFTWPVLIEAAGPGVLVAHRPGGVVLLIPDLDGARTASLVTRLRQCLGQTGWLTIARRPRNEIAAGFEEAADVMRIVLAGRRPCGLYSISDVLVEYAVLQQEQVAESLTSVIKRLRGQTSLWETLIALVDAEYNRKKAARSLLIHRTTLDYRLRRIADITGWDPGSRRGAQMLTVAMVADAARGPAKPFV